MRDSAADQPTIVEVLAAFLRVHAPAPTTTPSATPNPTTEPPRLAVDIQAALTVLGRRDPSKDRPGSRLDLSHTALPNANLIYADLAGANLPFATLAGANLARATLAFANLRDANLAGADLRGADLSGVDLTCALVNEYTKLPAGITAPTPDPDACRR